MFFFRDDDAPRGITPTAAADRDPTVLLEMRPALETFAGIPQETRLLFRGLCGLDGLNVVGLLQDYRRILAPGVSPLLPKRKLRYLTPSKRIHRYARVIISLADDPHSNPVKFSVDWMRQQILLHRLTWRTLLGGRVPLGGFRATDFEDFVWRTLFAKTLPAADFSVVASRDLRVCSIPWEVMHRTGLVLQRIFSTSLYPMLDTRGVDIFISQTPYPGRVDAATTLVIRYHDALPIFMPHTIPQRSKHQAQHFFALKSNVEDGAWFACVSKSTQSALLRVFPEAGARSLVIHNMLSHQYHATPAAAALVPGIVRSRLYPGGPRTLEFEPRLPNALRKCQFYEKHLERRPLRYLLIVSTIEPRKNHARLVGAWEVIKAELDPALKLLIVGVLGWDTGPIVKGWRDWIDRGQMFTLHAVPAPELRVLYQHATATVCPSVGEGFDFSGVESMASGGLVMASDIEVHREVYEDAAEYFDPYATSSLVEALRRTLYDPDASLRAARLRARGAEIARRYRPDVIMPRWSEFLGRLRGASAPASDRARERREERVQL